jgi:2-keto-4-pentenoate hydratase/2-oxohepta-3-ene-1,7-dioic acid hydratase in catechol pathway
MTLTFACKQTDFGFVNLVSQDGQYWKELSHGYQSTPLFELANAVREEGEDAILSHVRGDFLSSAFLASAPSVAGDGGDIWGAGLNYRGHAHDLDAAQPVSGPGSYLRPKGCLIPNGADIVLPPQSARVTAEAELGLVIGRKCKDVPQEHWRSVVVGLTAVLDMTAEDVIRENPRYIPWAKGFDTFCSIGPALVPLAPFDDSDIKGFRVATVRNGETVASAPVCDMRYDLGFLVAHFSAGRTLTPGTVICTGTPGAAVISDGDRVEALVESVGHLSHHVIAARAVGQEGQ